MDTVKKGASLAEMMASLPAERQANVQARTGALIDREMTLRELRLAMGRTQVAMAAKLGVKQENVSRLEQRADVMLSTLNGYLAAMGGRLRLVAEFEGREPVTLSGFGLAAVAEAAEAGESAERDDAVA